MQHANQAPARRADIPALTGLRFVAAFGVMYAHTVPFALRGQIDGGLPAAILIRFMHMAEFSMTLFFVLSGFVIHYNYATTIRNQGWSGIRQFLTARAARLYPLYLLCLAISVSQSLTTNVLNVPAYAILSYLTLTQAWFPIRIEGHLLWDIWIGGAWSISAEVFLYLVYIPIARFAIYARSPNTIERYTIGFAGIMAVVYAMLWIEVFRKDWAPFDLYHSPLARIAEFLLGVLCAQIVTAGPDEHSLKYRYRHLDKIGVALCAVWLVFTMSNPRIGGVVTSSWGYAVPVALIILGVATCDRRALLSRILSSKPMVALGDASYSIYMLHGYLNILFPGFSSWSAFAFKIATIWTTDFIVALGVYRALEVPTRAWVRAILGKRACALPADIDPDAVRQHAAADAYGVGAIGKLIAR